MWLVLGKDATQSTLLILSVRVNDHYQLWPGNTPSNRWPTAKGSQHSNSFSVLRTVRDGRFIGAIRVLETGEWQIIDGRGEPLGECIVPDGEQALKELFFPGY